jgi:hypothetical protein
VEPARSVAKHITQILLEAGVVDEAQVQAALEHQRGAGIRVGQALVELGAANEHDIGWALARQLGLSFIELHADSLDRDLVQGFPDGLLRRLLAVPLMRTERGLSVAFGDPTDHDAVRELERHAGRPVAASVAAPSEIHHVLDALADAAGAANPGSRHPAWVPAAQAHVAHGPQLRRAHLPRDGSGAQVLTDEVRRALAARASEIHYLPEDDNLRVYHRVAGRLVDAGTAPAGIAYAMLARLDALGGPVYDGEQTHAQGRAACRIDDDDLLLDVSLLGVEAGLAITLGLRPARRQPPGLEALGLDPVDAARVRGILDGSAGLVLVCGPPRSGCSTTLASLLAAVPSEGRRTLAFERVTGTPLPCPARLQLPPGEARERWAEIVVAQNADVVALDDVFTGRHACGLLASEAEGRLVLATSDWSDTFALLELLTRPPGGGTIVAGRLRLVIQQRMPADAGLGPAFATLFVGDAMRAALREGAAAGRLRAAALADGFCERAPEPGPRDATPPRLGAPRVGEGGPGTGGR